MADQKQSNLQINFGDLKFLLKTPANTPLDNLREKAAKKCGVPVSKSFVLQYFDDDFNEWLVVDEDYELPAKGRLQLIELQTYEHAHKLPEDQSAPNREEIGPKAEILRASTHLSAIRNTVWPMQADWRNLGAELLITPDTLDAIGMDPRNAGDKLEAVLKEWMNTRKATIDQLLSALRSMSVLRGDLADELLAHKDLPDAAEYGFSDFYKDKMEVLKFISHPMDMIGKPGTRITLSVITAPRAKKYKWYFQEQPVSTEDTSYEGSTTDSLCITKLLPKHKGVYKCVVTGDLNVEMPSRTAYLGIDGETLKHEESRLLGEILRRTGVDLAVYGVDVEQLAKGEVEVTYEEMEYLLKDSPITHVLAMNLKEELTARLEEEKLYKIAMVNDQRVSLSYTKILALGPGQVGKSTFLYRLMGIMKGNIITADPKTQPQSSTGIAELREACITYTSRTGALTAESWEVFDEESELQCQLDGLMSLLSEQKLNKRTTEFDAADYQPVPVKRKISSSGNDTYQSSTGEPISKPLQQVENVDADIQGNQEQQSNKLSTNASPTTEVPTTIDVRSTSSSTVLSETSHLRPQLSNIEKVMAEFNILQDDCKHAPNRTRLRMLFNIADIGGQPAFLEMLPSLTIGPALYLVFMKLLQGLTTRYPVAFKCKDGMGPKLCENYTYTSEEVIFTALSSIACFGHSDEEVERYVSDSGDEKQTSSLALLIGTFRDEIKDQKQLDSIDRQLKQQLEETDFFKDGLIYSNSILQVNNFSASETEIENQRKLLEQILETKFQKYQVPIRWLTLSICLKLLARMEKRHIVSFEDCVVLGRRNGMTEEMVKVALQFLHQYIGQVMYFPNNDHLKNVVICDPQVVFSSISELIFDIYDPRNMYITEAQHDHFVRTGCFSPQEINIENQQATKKLLPIDTLVHLLLHLKIIAEVPSSLGAQSYKPDPTAEAKDHSKKYFFLPAVLQTAELKTVSKRDNKEQLPEPLCIRFKTGYLPLGFICALSANLIANEMLKLIPFGEDGQQIIYKNKIRFQYQGKFDVIMISHSKYCEFHVSRCLNHTVEYWDSECCPTIRTFICEAADRVIQSMQQGSLYKLSKGYELAFKCPHHPPTEIGHEPLAKLVYDDSTSTSVNQPKEIMCVISSCMTTTSLSQEMKMWFGEAIPTHPPEITKELSVEDESIKLQVKGTKPLYYQWFKDDKELKDGENYEGSTTPELIIVETGPQSKGTYKCLVSNEYGEVMSQEKTYDPFVRKLKQKGLRDGEISKLIDNGVETLEDLECVTEDDTNLFGFTYGEKKRVRQLLHSAALMILCHPKDIKTKPGSSVEFFIETSRTAIAHEWHFQEQTISSDDADYRGPTTERLTVTKCLPKHKGAYKCVVTNTFGKTFTSESATLTIGGDILKDKECQLLGQIIKKTGVNLSVYGIDVEQLAKGEVVVTYEEMEYVLKDNPAVHVLAVNLKEQLTARLEEEKLYEVAMVNDQRVSLSYTKILALGPGQVGKTTFLYRLMGKMKGNILTADPKTQPQSSTGVTELQEACITYTSRTGALCKKTGTSAESESWEVFDEKSDLQRQLDGLMSLLSEQKLNKRPTESEAVDNQPVLTKEKLSSGTYQNSISEPINEPLQQVENDEAENHEQHNNHSTNESPTAEGQTTAGVTSTSPSTVLSETSHPCPQLSNIEKVIAEFNRLQDDCKHAPNKTKFRMLFNIADIGGQPAFLEMLPSLTIGPALYLVFMKLLQGLTTRYPAEFKCKDGRGSKLCKNYTYTSEEVIFTALSSIACFGHSDEEVERYVSDSGDEKKTSSLALLIGTFRDEIKDEKQMDDINHQLEQQLEETAFFKDGLIYLKSFHQVNNKEDEIECHRELLVDILETKFQKYEIPARWLTLSIYLKLLAQREERHEILLDDCVKLGEKLGMNKVMVKVALQFLHKHIGLVMYFPKNDHLKNVVICDPQVIFSTISELIFDIYDPKNMYITEAQHDHFVRTGCFSPQEINLKKEQATKKLLPIDTLVHLLLHLNIIAEVPSSLGVQSDKQELTAEAKDDSKKYYFLPAVLQTAELIAISRGGNEEQLPEPLCIRFKTGYLPLGFVCALSANLIANKEMELIPFKEDDQQLVTYKNKIRFRYQGKFDIIMISHPQYCEFHVSRCSDDTVEYWNSECCPAIRTIICEAANRVIQSMRQGSLYKLSKGYELAFKCPRHPPTEIGHELLAKLVYEDSASTSVNQPKEIVCVVSSCKKMTPLSQDMKMWFGEAILTHPPEITKELSVEDETIKLQAKGTKPLYYQWFKDDEELKDGENYEGSTTPELVIVGTGPQSKGIYKCQVSNKYGEVKSQEKKYYPFVRELKQKDLNDDEIFKLIANGIESLEDLENVTEDDINSEFGFNLGEKKRVRKLLHLEASQSDHPDLKDLKKALWDARSKWYLLGIQLCIGHPDLEVIRNEITVQGRFTEVLNFFLKGKPTKSLLVEALRSPSVGEPDLVDKLPSSLTGGQQTESGDSKTPADQLKRVVNALWDQRADWENIAKELIPSGTCKTIKKDHPNTGECFAAFLHEHLKSGDPQLKKLREALRNVTVGRADVADDLEEKIKKEELW